MGEALYGKRKKRFCRGAAGREIRSSIIFSGEKEFPSLKQGKRFMLSLCEEYRHNGDSTSGGGHARFLARAKLIERRAMKEIPVLSIEGARKSFNGREVLRGIYLSIGKKDMVSVMGKSGSGKSTLLAIMAGLLRPDDGKALYGDFDIGAADEEALAEFRLKTIGFVFQDFKLIPSLTVQDNILLGIYPRKDIDKTEKQRRIHSLAEEVGLPDRLTEPVNNLSGGEKQRVAIARSLVNQPAVALADEPTGNLDSKTADDIMALFQRLRQKHETSFLIVTHDPDIAAKTERVYRIQDGELMS